MIEFLASNLLSCADGNYLLTGINISDVPVELKSDLRIEILQSMPHDCDPEDYKGEDDR